MGHQVGAATCRGKFVPDSVDGTRKEETGDDLSNRSLSREG